MRGSGESLNQANELPGIDMGILNQPESATTAYASGETGGAVAPSDSTVLDFNALYVGVVGDIVVTVGGVDLTFVAVPAGTILPVRGTKVKATGTTASSIVWLNW